MITKISRFLFGLAIAVCLSQVVLGATYVVTKVDDTADGTCDSDCSLREAVLAANGTADNDTIIFTGFFNVPRTITLGGTDIIITNNGTLLINGPGADKLTVSGNNASRIFTNNTGSITTVSNLRATDGNGISTVATGRAGAIYNNAGTLTLNNLIINANTTTNGGGLNNAGTASVMNLNNCYVFGNTATASGGGIQNFSTSTLNINNSSISGNVSGSNTVGGGGIQGNGTVNIVNSTIANNTANTGSGGGIIFNGTVLNITNSTFAGNTATLNGGGIHKSTANPGNIRNTIISGNNGAAASPDATGAFNSLGNNVIGNIGTSTGWIMSDLQNTNPLLSPIGFYGGIGLSYALLSTSPALNAGQNCVTDLSCATNNPATAVTTDQRGASRSNVDIGAFEVSAAYRALLPTATLNQAYSTVLSPNVGSFTFTNTGGSPPAGVSVNTVGVITSVNGTPFASGVFDFAVTISNGMNSAVVNYRLYVLPTTVSVGGRITRADGNGASKVSVTLIDSGGNQRRVLSSSFGYYRFDNLNVGATYQVVVNSKTYIFSPNSQFIIVNETLDNVGFTAQP